MRNGFDNEKYLRVQSEHIKERIAKFGDKLRLPPGLQRLTYQYCRILPLLL